MRIISGRYRGRILESPKNAATHPMGDREKLALFNALANLISLEGASVLDCYAGSGALGLEALSRGAKEAIFVERDRKAVLAIEKNINLLGVKSQSKVLRYDISSFCSKDPGRSFDVIFIDPPYDNYPSTEDLSKLSDFLRRDGILALSHPAIDKTNLQAFFPGLELLSTKQYAAAHISFFKRP